MWAEALRETRVTWAGWVKEVSGAAAQPVTPASLPPHCGNTHQNDMQGQRRSLWKGIQVLYVARVQSIKDSCLSGDLPAPSSTGSESSRSGSLGPYQPAHTGTLRKGPPSICQLLLSAVLSSCMVLGMSGCWRFHLHSQEAQQPMWGRKNACQGHDRGSMGVSHCPTWPGSAHLLPRGPPAPSLQPPASSLLSQVPLAPSVPTWAPGQLPPFL